MPPLPGRRRYRCEDCRRLFPQALPGVPLSAPCLACGGLAWVEPFPVPALAAGLAALNERLEAEDGPLERGA